MNIGIHEESFQEVADYYEGALGPLCLLYFSSLTNYCKKNDINEIVFLSREGAFLSRAYSAFLDTIDEKISVKNIFVSRAFLVSILTQIDVAKLFVCSNFSGSVREFFETRLSSQSSKLDQIFYNKTFLDSNISLPEQLDKLTIVLKKYFDFMRPAIDLKKQLYISYLKSSSRLDKHSLVADVGYSGSIQKLLSKTIDRPLNGYYMVTTKNHDKITIGEDNLVMGLLDKLACFGEGNPVLDNSLLLEVLMSACHGPVTDIYLDHTGHGYKFIFGKTTYSQFGFPILKYGQDKLINFITRYANIFNKNIMDTDFVDANVCFIYNIMAHPLMAPELIQQIGYVDDIFLVNDTYSPWSRHFKNKSTGIYLADCFSSLRRCSC